MGSNPSPSPSSDALRPIVRSARGLRALHPRSAVGGLARSADRFAGDLGVATSSRAGLDTDGAAVSGTLPWGVWPRPPQIDTGAAVAAGLDPSLAGYAAMLRRRQRPVRVRAPKVLPLLVRRDGATARGPGTGPGGLARRAIPVDHPVSPLEARLTRDPLAGARAVAAATKPAAAGSAAATPRPSAATGRGGTTRRSRR